METGFLDSADLENSVDQVGLDIWESATDLLCNYISANSHLVEGRQVIELGAGIGLVSVLAAKLGAKSVICTDYDPVVLKIAFRNSELNDVKDSCVFEKFDWDSATLPFSLSREGSPILLLGSDLMYSTACATKLRKAVQLLLLKQPSAVMLLSHEIRHSVTWGRDCDGQKIPVVETSDSVLESFLAGCKPVPFLSGQVVSYKEHDVPADRLDSYDDANEKVAVGSSERPLYACVLRRTSKDQEKDVPEHDRDVDSHEMCSAAEVEEMTLQLMRKAMTDGTLRPDDADDQRDSDTLIRQPPVPAAVDECVRIDTSRSGEAILMAFSLESHQLTRLRDSSVPTCQTPVGTVPDQLRQR